MNLISMAIGCLVIPTTNSIAQAIPIIRHSNINAQDDQGNTALHRAAQNGQLDQVKSLLLQGASLKKVNNFAETPLYLAATNGHLEVAKLLLAKGANWRAQNSLKISVLQAATRGGSVPLVNLLLDRGADPAAVDSNGMNSLHWAAVAGNYRVVEILLAKGMDINARDFLQRTPLSTASMATSCAPKESVAKLQKTVELLLTRGADVKNIDKLGQTAIRYADKFDISTLQMFLDRGANINERSAYNGHSLLMQIVNLHPSEDEQQILPKVEFLLQRGADLSIKSYLPLDIQESIVKTRQMSPISWVITMAKINHQLASDGVFADETALQIAERLNRPKLVELLKKYDRTATPNN
jgi:ankyrin repeat protein